MYRHIVVGRQCLLGVLGVCLAAGLWHLLSTVLVDDSLVGSEALRSTFWSIGVSAMSTGQVDYSTGQDGVVSAVLGGSRWLPICLSGIPFAR